MENFWELVRRSGFLSSPNLILGGDLNLTLKASETWGDRAVIDPLFTHFHHFFDSLGLMDIDPPNSSPTWRNGRVGNNGISKRLDRFLIVAILIPSL